MLQTVAANALMQGTNLLIGVITARWLGPVGRGELAAIILWPQLIAFCVTLGIPASLTYNMKHRPNDAGKLFWAATAICLTAATLASIAGVMIIPLWLGGYPTSVLRAAQISMISAPASLLAVVLTGVFQVRNDFKRYNLLRYTPSLLSLVALCCFVVTGGLNTYTAALSIVLSQLPVVAWAFLHLWRGMRPLRVGGREVASRLLSYGLKMYGSDVLQALAGQIDRVLVVAILAPEVTGIYVVAISLSRTLSIFSVAAVAVVFPAACGRSDAEILRIVNNSARVTFATTAVVALCIALAGPAALQWVYGKAFVSAVLPLRILLVEAVLGALTVILSQALLASGRAGTITLIQGGSVALGTALLVLLVPRLGAMGAALAVLLSTCLRLGGTSIAIWGAFRSGAPPRLSSLRQLRGVVVTGSRAGSQ